MGFRTFTILGAGALTFGLVVISLASQKPNSIACKEAPSRVRLEASETTYDMAQRLLEIKEVTATLTEPCSGQAYTLKSPKGTYDEKSGTLKLSQGVKLTSDEVSASADEAVLEAKTSVAHMSGNLKLKGKVQDVSGKLKKDSEVVIEAQKALIELKTGAFEVKGPVKAWGADYSGEVESAKGNIKEAWIEVCCSIVLKKKDSTFSLDKAVINLETQDLKAPGPFKLVYQIPEEERPRKKKAVKKDNKSGFMTTTMDLNVETITLKGRELVYAGKTGAVKTTGAVEMIFGPNQGHGKVGAFTGNLKNASFDLGSGVSFELGKASFTAGRGHFNNQKQLLELREKVKLREDAPEGERTLQAQSATVQFRQEGAIMSLQGGVALDLFLPPDALSGSLKL